MTTKAAFLRRVQEVAAAQGVTLPDRSLAERATGAVFQALHRRITPAEADHVAAQLPRDLERLWQGSWYQGLIATLQSPETWDRDAFFTQVARIGTFPQQQIPAITAAVFTALRESLSPGEAADVAAQLPPDLRAIWASGAGAAEHPPVAGHEARAPAGLVGEVPKGEWAPFLAGLAAHYRDAPVILSVLSPDGRLNRLAGHLPLLGMEPEIEPEGVRSIEVLVGETGGEHPAHLMHRALHPERLYLQVNPQGYARLLNIESQDGSRTLVQFAA